MSEERIETYRISEKTLAPRANAGCPIILFVSGKYLSR